MRESPPHAASPAIILFAHGARDPEWAQPFRKIQRAIRSKRPGVAVELAFLEISEPPLDMTVAKLVAAGHRRITVAPLFMAQGRHLKQDLPKILDAIRGEHPGTEIALLPAIGDVDAILDAISDWLISVAAR
jgi:sirohydrochlorin cobaltochelatase